MRGRGVKVDFKASLCERALGLEELDLEMADVLPHRDTLGVPAINVVVAPTVVINTGVAIATQVLSHDSVNSALVLQSVHIAY